MHASDISTSTLLSFSELERFGMSLSVYVILSCLLLIGCLDGVLGKKDSEHLLFKDLKPKEGRLEFESDGGRLEVWGGSDSGAFRDANVAAAKTTLKRLGLWLPSYTDVPCLEIVTRGRGRVGIVSPSADKFTQNTFKVERGDVVAIPEGFTTWWYNDDDEDLEIVGVAEVSTSTRPGGLKAFHLAGGKEDEEHKTEEHKRRHDEKRKSEDEREDESSSSVHDDVREQDGYTAIIHGFSTEVLSRAWNVDKDTVRTVLKSQKGCGIIRLEERLTFSEAENNGQQANNFIYRLGQAHPDLKVSDGGELREVNSFKLPALKNLKMGIECMHLEQHAMVAPNWFHGAHQVLYVVEGHGRVEVTYNNGESAVASEVKEGNFLVIPAFFPSTKIAGEDGLHYISFVTSDRPTISYLAGRNSVYRAIPMRVLGRMLNLNDEVARRIQRAHEEEVIIFSKPSVNEAVEGYAAGI